MFHRVRSVVPMSNCILRVQFRDGSVREYDCKGLSARIPCFAALEQIPGLFEQVRTDAGGFGVSWNDELDLACDELWTNGQPR